MEKESHLLELCRYMVLNPVRAGMVRAAKDWRWSSYRATAGLTGAPGFLATGGVLAHFGQNRGPARAAYRRFVGEGAGAPPWSNLSHQIVLGSEAFVECLAGKLGGRPLSREVPRGQRRATVKTLAAYQSEAADRDAAIRAAWLSGGYGLAEIGEHFGLHYSWVSRIANARNKT